MALRTLAIDPVTGGFVMASGSPTFIEGKEARAQQIRILFQTVQGEYFLNPFLGIPYYDDILVKNPNIRFIESLYVDALKLLGMSNIVTTGSFDKVNRVFYLSWQAVDDEDNIVQGTF